MSKLHEYLEAIRTHGGFPWGTKVRVKEDALQFLEKEDFSDDDIDEVKKYIGQKGEITDNVYSKAYGYFMTDVRMKDGETISLPEPCLEKVGLFNPKGSADVDDLKLRELVRGRK